MANKKTRVVQRNAVTSKPLTSQAGKGKSAIRKKSLWQRILQTAFYIIMSAMIVMAIVHYTKHYIHLVNRK